MGVAYSITLIHSDSIHLDSALLIAQAKIHEIEQQISSWLSTSETSKINQNAGIQPVKVSTPLFKLIQRCLKISSLTNGAFDISFASMDKLWRFDGHQTTFPDSTIVRKAISKINYRNITLHQPTQTIFLKEKGMKIGFGAIGKGFAADEVKQYLIHQLNIQSGIINAGGDLAAWGKPLENKHWKIGIANPTQRQKIIGWLHLDNTSIATSGDYEKYILYNGKRYSHIINPKTGYPTTGIQSVTVVCDIAEIADGLATAVFVLGIEKGMKIINTLTGVECLIIDDKNKVWTSNGLKLKSD
jgi:thiamine biosynthesis lipoprotein